MTGDPVVPLGPSRRTLWITADGSRCYLVPSDATFEPGELQVVGPTGATMDVTPASIASHAIGQAEARTYLRGRWDNAVAGLRGAWTELAWFTELTGDDASLEEAISSVREGISSAGDGAEDAVALAAAIVESITHAREEIGEEPDLDERAALRATFGRLPELLQQFLDPALDAAATDPDAWAQRLSTQVFGDPHGGGAARRRRELSNEISASIAQRLREAGIEPSLDDVREAPEPAPVDPARDPAARPVRRSED